MSQLVAPEADRQPLYLRVAAHVESLIDGGTLRPGERVPSLRSLSSQLKVSISTVMEAYRVLEDRRLIAPRPRSGYFVLPRRDPPEPERTATGDAVEVEDESSLLLDLMADRFRTPRLLPLGEAEPWSDLLPTTRLSRLLAQSVKNQPELSQAYDSVRGYQPLRVQIARRALEAGCSLTPDSIVTTAGAQQAVLLCLKAVTQPGDLVAVESPTYYGLFEIIRSLNLRALEIATDPNDGVCLEALEQALDRQPVKACVFVPTFGNPLGHAMPDDSRRRLVELLAERQVPLIEDDVYGDIAHGPNRPRAVRAFDSGDNVMLCSSFSKTLAPGYRIGWVAPGKYRAEVERLKFSWCVASATPTQMAVAAFLETGGFDRYLRRLRRTYADLMCRMRAAVCEHFPQGTRATRPQGGHLLWVELPAEIDSVRLRNEALGAGIGIAPGPMFSSADGFRNFLRLNTAVAWSDQVVAAVRTLGALAHKALD